MRQTLLHEKYPLFTLEVEKQESRFSSVDQIIAHLKQCIDQHPVAAFIATFDHYQHTNALADGQIDESILDAKCIIFCFGITLPNPQVMAVRPRSIGVVEQARSFLITFMEAPMPVANVAMESWAEAVRDRQAA